VAHLPHNQPRTPSPVSTRPHSHVSFDHSPQAIPDPDPNPISTRRRRRCMAQVQRVAPGADSRGPSRKRGSRVVQRVEAWSGGATSGGMMRPRCGHGAAWGDTSLRRRAAARAAERQSGRCKPHGIESRGREQGPGRQRASDHVPALLVLRLFLLNF
jgi:hypothetical protein